MKFINFIFFMFIFILSVYIVCLPFITSGFAHISPHWTAVFLNKGNTTITELRAILQRESQNS